MADRVLVNSRFTSSALLRAFPRLALVPEVLYPGVDVSRYPRVAAPDGNDVDGQNGCIPHLSEARELEAAGRLEKSPAAQGASAPFGKGGGERSERGIWARCRRDGRDVELRGTNWECTRQNFLILSLSRYEPKKNLGLAIDAVACLRRLLPPDSFSGVRLVIAGGYDQRLRECSETLRSLETQARQLGIESQVTFACSPTDAERIDLLSRCSCVVYTPVEEHFGYVPLEAMAAGRPVVAANRGGPVETIVDGGTGFLCDPTPEAFAGALLRLLGEPGVIDQMGRAGRAHVQEHFSMTVFGQRIEKILRDTVVRG
jgi:glycosyltransferase involved in cell wall biosynthesis